MTDKEHRPQNPPHQVEALVNAGKATQFGGERANPTAGELGIKRGSIRSNIRYLVKSGELTFDEKTKKFSLELPKKATVAQVIASQAILDSLNVKSGNTRLRAIEFLTEQVDGKLAQTNINAELDALNQMGEEDLDGIIAGLISQLRDAKADLDHGATDADPQPAAQAGDPQDQG